MAEPLSSCVTHEVRLHKRVNEISLLEWGLVTYYMKLTPVENDVLLWFVAQCRQSKRLACTFSYNQLSIAVKYSIEEIHTAIVRFITLGMFQLKDLPIFSLSKRYSSYIFVLVLPMRGEIILQRAALGFPQEVTFMEDGKYRRPALLSYLLRDKSCKNV